MLETLEHRRVLVTGGASGIGLAVARCFAAAGSVVGVNYLPDDPRGQEVVGSLQRDGYQAHTVPADVSDEGQVLSAVRTFTEAAGPVEVLVSNAGIGTHQRFLDISAEDWQRMIAVHLFGARNTVHAVLPRMIEAGRGVIIFTASEQAAIGAAGLTHYCAAKGGIVSFAKALAREVGEHGITVNCVAPGPTETELLTSYPAEYNDEIRDQLPLRRWGTPEEVAWSYAFLAGRGGGWFTGQVISPNGGAAI